LGLIREKLATTQASAVALNLIVMNLDKLLELYWVIFSCWLQLLLVHRAVCNSHVAVLSDQSAAA
jgi:transposase, IS5 family